MTQPIKLLLLIPHLGGGGAEQVTSLLAQRLDPERFDINLGLIAADGPGAKQPPPWVTVHRLGAKRIRRAWFGLIRLIWKLRPDAILSNMTHLNFLILSIKPFLPTNTRILARQNTTASAAANPWITRISYRWLYPRADAILCQSSAMAIDMEDRFGIPHRKLAVLLNPIDIEAIRVASKTRHSEETWRPGQWPRLLSVGRLAREKGHDLLLQALAKIRESYPHAHLTILGSGEEESSLRCLSHELHVSEALDLPGHVSELSSWYAQATLFVLPSRFEGMPNALLEAAAAGLPLVSTPCCAGVSILFQNSPGAWLASEISAAALAESILESLPHLAFPANAPRRYDHAFVAPFEAGITLAAYETLIEQVVTQGRP